MTELQITNPRGEKIAATLHGALADHLVICCHGMLSTKDGHKHQMLAELLIERDVPCLRFDFAGRGASEGSLWDLSYSRQMEDLDAVINHAAERGVRRFALFGSSMGGAVAYLAAGRDERVIAIATLAAVAHPDAISERHPEAARQWNLGLGVNTEEGEVGPAFFADAQSHSVLACVRILRIPILAIHGEDDAIVPCSDAHDIATTARRAELDIVPGADHRFSNPLHLRPAMNKIAAFLASSFD